MNTKRQETFQSAQDFIADDYHASEMMETIARLREKYDLHMTLVRYVSDKQQTD